MSQLKREKYNLKMFTDNDNHTSHWVNRVLFVLSFKEAHTQNLRFITKVLGITSSDERKEYMKEILRMIQRGIIYVPKGLPYLIENQSKFNLDNPMDLESIELCLLHPFRKLMSELKAEFILQSTEEFTVAVH
ncbi:MAG: hypothetical protein ACTSQH_01710 [Candidatus Hodarchaeales archaeon]